MRRVSRKELMELPAGTVYSYYEPHVFHGLQAKDETCAPDGKPIDWFTRSLLDAFDCDSTDMFEVAFDPLERGEDVPLEFGVCFGRDAAFNEADRFGVWSKQDLLGLAAFLTKAAEVAK
jgi:hypothetical protein